MTIKQTLKGSQVFSALSDAELEKIAALAQEKQYEAGMAIFQEGDSAEELFVIQEGKVAGQMILPRAQSGSGRKLTVDVMTQNEVVGWSALVEPYTYTLTAVCLQNVKAISISGNKLRDLLRDNPKMGYEVVKGLIRVVASRLNDTRQMLVSERLSLTRPE
ncbi:MAG: cyclic nucleotide-binding domain-containing protein [Chloroflexi bacterium]|nr:cyclic nucleotide-binding domain-containing protein [Chloroflexota bacterium]